MFKTAIDLSLWTSLSRGSHPRPAITASPSARSSGPFHLRAASWSAPSSPYVAHDASASPDNSTDGDSDLRAARTTIRELLHEAQPFPSQPLRRGSTPTSEDLITFQPVLDSLHSLLKLKMAQPYRLPPHGASGAPSFEPDQPETLLDFFEDLEYMLEQADVSEDQKRKDHAVRYTPSTQKALWRGFDSYDVQNGKSYDKFKAEIVKE